MDAYKTIGKKRKKNEWLDFEGAEERCVEVEPPVEPDDLGGDIDGFEVDDPAGAFST